MPRVTVHKTYAHIDIYMMYVTHATTHQNIYTCRYAYLVNLTRVTTRQTYISYQKKSFWGGSD